MNDDKLSQYAELALATAQSKVCEALNTANIKVSVASALANRSKGWGTKLLRGDRDLTVRDMARICAAAGFEVSFSLVPVAPDSEPAPEPVKPRDGGASFYCRCGPADECINCKRPYLTHDNFTSRCQPDIPARTPAAGTAPACQRCKSSAHLPLCTHGLCGACTAMDPCRPSSDDGTRP